MKWPKTWFENHYALAELPYFTLEENQRLILADPSFGPSVDVHTHLALAYLRKLKVDLWAEHDRTEHYLPLDGSLDLEVYQNKNFTPDDLKRLKRDLTLKSVTASGMRRTHTAANLLAEMSDLGIIAAVMLPIDFPILSRNAETYLEVAEKRRELISLGSVHPFARNVAERLESQKAMGAQGVKVHPAVQLIAPDHPRAMALYRICADLELPILFHCGPVGIEGRLPRRLCQLKHYWRAVKDNPGTVFILGHSGALQMEQALELAQRYENVYLETASQSLSNVRRIVEDGPRERIMMGSDWPFYHQVTALAKVLMATEDLPEMRQMVLRENAARLFGIELAP